MGNPVHTLDKQHLFKLLMMQQGYVVVQEAITGTVHYFDSSGEILDPLLLW